jgi:hypothetical protein
VPETRQLSNSGYTGVMPNSHDIGAPFSDKVPRAEPFKCPHCDEEIQRDLIIKAAGRFIGEKRKISVGPPKVLYKCGCGHIADARNIRKHKRVKPNCVPRDEETRLSEKEAQKYVVRVKNK